MRRTQNIPTICRMCEQGCGLEVTVENGRPVGVKLAERMGFGKYFPWKTCQEGIDYIIGGLDTIHIPQGWEEANANELTGSESADPVSGFPNLKSLRCRILRLYHD